MKKKSKKKKKSLAQLKTELENLDPAKLLADKMAYKMLKGKKHKVIDPKKDAERKAKKHKNKNEENLDND